MKRHPSAHDSRKRQPGRAENPPKSRRRTTIVFFGLCRPAIFILVASHIMLGCASAIKVICPALDAWSQFLELVAHNLMAGLWLYKIIQYKTTRPGRGRIVVDSETRKAESKAADGGILIAIDDEQQSTLNRDS